MKQSEIDLKKLFVMHFASAKKIEFEWASATGYLTEIGSLNWFDSMIAFDLAIASDLHFVFD